MDIQGLLELHNAISEGLRKCELVEPSCVNCIHFEKGYCSRVFDALPKYLDTYTICGNFIMCVDDGIEVWRV